MTDDKTGVFAMPGEAAEEGVAYLMVLSGPDSGLIYKLLEGEYDLGRGADAGLRVHGDGVSRIHAKVVARRDGSVHVKDLGSTNGTFKGSQRIEQVALADGEQIQFGSVVALKFSREEEAEDRFEQHLYQSSTQSLTGVYNAQFFREQLEIDFSHAIRHSADLSLVMFSIDALDRIAASRGPNVADAVVRWTARRVANTIRREDVLCRLADNEFGALLRTCPARNALQFATRIAEVARSQPFDHDGENLEISVSVGAITLERARHASADMFVGDAKRYLERAAAQGPGRVESGFQDG